jgi:hypothetical protein
MTVSKNESLAVNPCIDIMRLRRASLSVGLVSVMIVLTFVVSLPNFSRVLVPVGDALLVRATRDREFAVITLLNLWACGVRLIPTRMSVRGRRDVGVLELMVMWVSRQKQVNYCGVIC